MKLAAYLRVSTDRQADEGYGLDVQKQDIKRWAKTNGHRVVAWFADEGKSGGDGINKRESLKAALEALNDGIAEVLITKNLDRLARKLTVQEAILAYVWDHGAKCFTVEDDGEVVQDDPNDPMRTAMRQMRGVFAELERAMLVKRMQDGRRTKAADGGYAYGAPPLGKRAVAKNLVADPSETKTVKRITQLHRQGNSLRQIAQVLEDEGCRTKRGGRWHPVTIARILERA